MNAQALSALASTPIIVKTNDTAYWVVAFAAAAGFVAAAIGAGLAGWISWKLSDREWKRRVAAEAMSWQKQLDAQHDQWLRERRAALYTGSLYELHNWVNDTAQEVEGSQEPLRPPSRAVPGSREESMGVLFSTVYREASAISREDGQMVIGFQKRWDEVWEVFNEWRAKVRGATSPSDHPETSELHNKQLAAWRGANTLLNNYGTWLQAYLGAEPLESMRSES